jgi:hypothetical protein
MRDRMATGTVREQRAAPPWGSSRKRLATAELGRVHLAE